MTGHVVLVGFLGPVQEFIGSARRTRDLWAGSFLLSWLSGLALRAVLDGQGVISLPAVYAKHHETVAAWRTKGRDGPAPGASDVTERTLRAILDAPSPTGDVSKTDDGAKASARADGTPNLPLGPLTGSLVNHFRAEVPASFDPEACRREILAGWRRLAAEVRKSFVAPVLAQMPEAGFSPLEIERVEAIWRRQIEEEPSFFEFMWVEGPIGCDWKEERLWLERRKTWRSHAHAGEAGLPGGDGFDRCFIHPDLAELSGFVRARGGRHRERQDRFWELVRTNVNLRLYGHAVANEVAADVIEIRENERLSAQALVKRLFPLLSEQSLVRTIGWIPTLRVAGAYLPPAPEAARLALRNWPSTAFMAATPWLVAAQAKDDAATVRYVKAVNELLPPIDSRAEAPQYHKISAIAGATGTPKSKQLFSFDGRLFYGERLSKQGYDEETEARLQAALDDFEQEVHALGRPSPFYAFLQMDGDHFGRKFEIGCEAAEIASQDLDDFSAEALAIIRAHDGVTIYAGADDVAALLPVDRALACAAALRRLFTETLSQISVYEEASISAGIVFADFQSNLRSVRDAAKHLLDDAAKERNGRDSFAVAVMRAGGLSDAWASTWTATIPDEHGSSRTGDVLAEFEQLLEAFADDEASPLARGFPYGFRESFGVVLGALDETLLDNSQLDRWLSVELGGSLREAAKSAGAEPALRRFSFVLRDRPNRCGASSHLPPSQEDPSDPDLAGSVPGRNLNGILLARFLAGCFRRGRGMGEEGAAS